MVPCLSYFYEKSQTRLWSGSIFTLTRGLAVKVNGSGLRKSSTSPSKTTWLGG
jgi:hypothetical protein